MSGTVSIIYPRIGEKIQVVHSTYGYASGYRKPKSIPEQVNTLCGVFPHITRELLGTSTTTKPVPAFAEGLFVIPHWGLIAQTYASAVLAALEELEAVRGSKICKYYRGEIGSENFRRNFNTERALRSIHGGDEDWWHKVFTIPAQFGIQYRGASSHWAKRTFTKCEFGLGLFEVIIMLITHPERLSCNDDLWIECPGDSYSFTPDNDPLSTPFLNIIDGEIGVGTVPTYEPGARYGSATLFLP
ncbi:MAG: hypothetical protein A2V96_02795 [Candidatus Yonathbacteria bacterium RBG_16_43_6]|uniref:Uncharacterized protein n=2 Tax=Parcubacteria group TaxID=1794811 RepID=A0A1G2SD02_9BACT|nr:MAG: hypothetical protein UW78_C0006G0081 [Candidatus Azambacteria bacterium GW2011_GWA1_44_9]OHA78798.1 MAG: hypothetical protein A2658_00185 [Candidatus Yonathbacteria bacterium RIFCSPHIGHO2_01_FULL_44_19]OHA80259.1 MAG: hypothetical protein A2V96_02795 [Candidatus Yonathbacteria bacterium RBG_16_43_6]OHA82874.1 MAG: hypothetical protein A3B07_03230 [Candidatus Yonathbacteria bacterium RIFCSPLOWO2_01_FULL_43_27]